MLAVIITLAPIAAAAPAPAPTTRAAPLPEYRPFTLAQAHSINEGETIRSDLYFAGNYAVALDEDGELLSFCNLRDRSCFVHRFDRMIAFHVLDGWLKGWRAGARLRQQITDPELGPFFRSLLWPELKVSEDDAKLLIRTKAMHVDVVPMKDVNAGSAAAYATFYQLDALRNALEKREGSGAFIAAAVADVFRQRQIVPAEMTVTSFTPKGSATLKMTLNRELLDEEQVASLMALAKRLDVSPQTQPIDPDAETQTK